MSQATIQDNASALHGRPPWSEARCAAAVCAGLVVGVALVYGQTLRYGFLGLDDPTFVSDEPNVSHGCTWSGIVWALIHGPAGDWCPLAMLSHMLDCQLFGLAPAGHHFTNLLLHAASAVTLFLVLWRMTDQRAVPGSDRRLVLAQESGVRAAPADPSATNQRAVPGTDRRLVAAQASGVRVAPAGPSATNAALWPSAVVAAIFALHPLHVESVAWIAERRDVLSGLLFMLTLGAYGEYARRPDSLVRYLAVAALLALGLMAKTMLVTLPPLLLLLDFWPLARFGWPADAGSQDPAPASAGRLIVEKLPLVALALAAAGVAVLSHRVTGPNPVLTLPERLATGSIAYVAYLGQFFVPIDLSVFYSYPRSGWPPWQVAAALVLLLAITSAAVITRRAYPYFFVGWFWYVGMLLPVAQIIPFGAHARADRYTYLSQIGLTIALVWGALQLVATWPARRWIVSVGSVLVLAALTACAWRQTGYWQNDQRLWKHALACDPNSAVVHYQLGIAWKYKDPAAAKAQCQQALELAEGDRDFYYGTRARAYALLAYLVAHEGNLAEGGALLEQSLAINPDDPSPRTLLGLMLLDQRDFDRALPHFRRCIELQPANPMVWCNLALALSQAGQVDEAIAVCRRATEIDPSQGIAERNLADYLVQGGRLDEAIAHLRRAIQLDPDDPQAYYQLANLLREQGKRSEAVKFDERGNQAGVRLANTKNRRGSELAGEGKLDEAIALFEAAIEADAHSAQARCHLADALAQQGKTGQAADQYRQALEIAPDCAPARQGLEKLQGR